jgi:hypothetical protein
MPVRKLASAMCCILRKLNAKSKPKRVRCWQDWSASRSDLSSQTKYLPGILEPKCDFEQHLPGNKKREAGNQPPVANAVSFGFA